QLDREVYSLTTTNYHIHTTVSEDFANLIADHMEQIFREYRSRLDTLFGGRDVDKMQILVFESQRDYIQALGNIVQGSRGVFIPDKKILAGFIGNDPPDVLFNVLYHEGFHQFVHHYIAKRCPVWLNEGLAQYFSEAIWTGKRFEVGGIPPHRLTILRRNRKDELIDVERLLSISSEEWMNKVNTRDPEASTLYNEAWLLTHFLIDGANGRFRPKFREYIEKIADGEGSYEAFVDCFGDNFSKLQELLDKYLQQLEPSKKYICMQNVRTIGGLLHAIISHDQELLDDIDDMEDLHDLLKDMKWQLTLQDGTTLDSEDGDKLDEFFQCPFDSNNSISYRLFFPQDNELPAIECDHHPGDVRIIGWLSKNAFTGEIEVSVFEKVPTKHSDDSLSLESDF
ncbi:MAG: DUF1570 domain-containing protein, partial [Verrucomicrobiota bacterium]